MTESATKRPKGASANTQGKVLERTVVPCLESHGFEFVKYSEWKNTPERFGGELVLRNVPYRTIYDHKGFTEFLLRSKRLGLEIRIECKWQQSGGSVDEKLPYLYLNCLETITEPEVIIIIGGGGMKKGAIQWLKDAVKARRYATAAAVAKRIHVFTIDEFLAWANKTFRK